MSIRAVETELPFDVQGSKAEPRGGERAIVRPAGEMTIVPSDLPTRWAEVPVKASEKLHHDSENYAVSRFALMDGRKEKGLLSFETIVYRNHKAASDVLVKMLSRMSCLKLTRVALGDAGAMMEAAGKAGRRMKALAFVERNVYGLIMLSCDSDCNVSDSWLIGMGRIMVSRMH